MKHLSFLRKRYLINQRFQLSFIAYNVAMAILLAGVFYVAIRFFFTELAELGVEAGLPEDHVFFTFLREQTHLMNMVFLKTLLVTVSLLGVFALFISHKVAGPLYRFTKHMEKIAGGEPPSPVHFREADYFQELAEAYNRQLKRVAPSSDRNDSRAA